MGQDKRLKAITAAPEPVANQSLGAEGNVIGARSHLEPRILMLTYWFPPAFTGAGLQASRLAERLVRHGLSVQVVAADPGGRRLDEPAHASVPLPVHRIALPRSGRPTRLAYALSVAPALCRRRHQYDIVHIHGIGCHSYVAMLTARLLRKPFVVKITLLGQDDSLTILRSGLGRLKLRILAQASGIVCMSKEIAEGCLRAGMAPSALYQIPNGVDTELYRPLDADERSSVRRQFGFRPEEQVVVYLGVITERKGLRQLTAAWPQVAREHPAARLVLVGPLSRYSEEESPFADELKALLVQSDEGRRVQFAGQVAPATARKYLQAADVFVFPSCSEGMPNALLEAMSCGLPCIATRIPGIKKDVATDGVNARLYDPFDVDGLRRCLAGLLSDRSTAEQLGRHARRTAEEVFAVTRVTELYIALYRDLITR